MKPTFPASAINKKENNKTKGKVSIKNPRKWKLYNSRKQIFRKP
jgi:hypothetical protein